MDTDFVRAIVGATQIQRKKAAPLNTSALFEIQIEYGANLHAIDQLTSILPEEPSEI